MWGETFCSIRQIRICLQVKCVFLHCRVNLQQRGRFRASKAAQSRRGKRKTAFPPDPLLPPWSWSSGCFAGRLWFELFCQGCFISFSNNKNYGARSLCRSLLPTYPKQYQKKE